MRGFTLRRGGLAAAIGAALLGVISLGAAHTTQAASAPAYVYGHVSLFGNDITGSPAVRAVIGTTNCGTGKVSSAAYSVIVNANCGSGRTIKFEILFSTSSTNGDDAYWANETLTFPGDGLWRKLDLTAPLLQAPTSLSDPSGCTLITSSFSNKTTVDAIAANISPSTALDSIWKQDAKSGNWTAYILMPSPKDTVKTLKTLNRGDSFWVCVTDPTATLTQPA